MTQKLSPRHWGKSAIRRSLQAAAPVLKMFWLQRYKYDREAFSPGRLYYETDLTYFLTISAVMAIVHLLAGQYDAQADGKQLRG